MKLAAEQSPILCGVDKSTEAAVAARVAGRIAVMFDRPLVLAHAAPMPWVPDRPYEDYRERLRERTDFERAGYLHTVVEPLPLTEPERASGLVEWGYPPADALRSATKRLGAELIVVGTRGQSAAAEMFSLGSTSTGLAKDAQVPVVLTPAATNVAEFPAQALACGVDGSEPSLFAAQVAAQFADRLHVPLVVVGVNAEGDTAGYEESVAPALARVAPDLELRVERERGSVAEGLLSAAARSGAGLIAVGSRGRGAIRSVLLGSVTSDLLRLSDRPLLVVSNSASDAGAGHS